MPKYKITKPRFVQQVGQSAPAYVPASPEAPAVIEVAEKKSDRDLLPLDEELEPLKKHYAAPGQGVVTAADLQSKPLEPVEPLKGMDPKGGKPQRPSDKGL